MKQCDYLKCFITNLSTSINIIMCFKNKKTSYNIKMSLQTTTIVTFMILFSFSSLSKVDARTEAIQNPRLMKLIWLPNGENPPSHISSEAFDGPQSQLPYINVSPSRAPKQLLRARYNFY